MDCIFNTRHNYILFLSRLLLLLITVSASTQTLLAQDTVRRNGKDIIRTARQDTIRKGYVDTTRYIRRDDLNVDDEVIFSTDTNLVHNIGWVRAYFLDAWFLQLQGGTLLYCGTEDKLGPLGDRLSYSGEATLGRWVFPMVGYRIGMGYGHARGFLSKNTYRTAGREGTAYGWGKCEGDLGGYYYNFDKDTSLLVQKWKYFYVKGDALVNLTYGREYDPTRPWMTWIYAGVSAYFGRSEGYEGTYGVVKKESDPNRGAELHFGLIEKYQVTPDLHLYLDFRASAMQRTFDREWVRSTEKPMGIADLVFHAQFGVDWNFNFRSKEKRLAWYKENINEKYDGSESPRHIIARQSINIVTKVKTYKDIIDTLYAYDTVKYKKDDFDRMIQAAVQQALHDSIAAMQARNAEALKHATITDILDEQLLPYEMVFFDLDQWDIRSTENEKIAKMATFIKSNPNQKFLIIGSADSRTGTPKRNTVLSENRAKVIYNKLVIDYGIDKSQLKMQALGGIADYEPYELNRATTIIMDHPRVMEEFRKLKRGGRAGGGIMRRTRRMDAPESGPF